MAVCTLPEVKPTLTDSIKFLGLVERPLIHQPSESQLRVSDALRVPIRVSLPRSGIHFVLNPFVFEPTLSYFVTERFITLSDVFRVRNCYSAETHCDPCPPHFELSRLPFFTNGLGAFRFVRALTIMEEFFPNTLVVSGEGTIKEILAGGLPKFEHGATWPLEYSAQMPRPKWWDLLRSGPRQPIETGTAKPSNWGIFDMFGLAPTIVNRTRALQTRRAAIVVLRTDRAPSVYLHDLTEWRRFSCPREDSAFRLTILPSKKPPDWASYLKYRTLRRSNLNRPDWLE